MPVLTSSRRTAIEQGYLDQEYKLPEGWTWERVAELRRAWNVSAIYVPIQNNIGAALGIVAWGAPFVDGTPRKHPVEEET